MQKLLRIFVSLLCIVICAPALYAANIGPGSDDGFINYSAKSGDTLIDIGKRYLNSPSAYRTVQQQNRIADPRLLPVGKVIRIARSLLKYQAVTAKVISVRGNVMIGAAPASAGQNVGEGVTLRTAASSFITLSLPNGSRVSLPSNSDLRIRLLRTYTLGGALDYDFDVAKGGASTRVTPLNSADDRYRVRTPRAVSAVRGTDFQVRYDAALNRDFAEVTEGALAVGAGVSSDIALPAGNGLAIPPAGAIIREALLPEPVFIEPGKIQANPELLFAVNPAQNEAGYRVTLAADAGFVEQLADVVITGREAKLANINDGNYFLRARAISANGIQGVPVTYAFKRRLNGVSATAGAGNDGYNFKWQSDGGGIRKFHFQLFTGWPNGTAMIDEPALLDQQITISDLPPGDYFWRVGAVQYAGGEVATNWTSFEKLSVTR